MDLDREWLSIQPAINDPIQGITARYDLPVMELVGNMVAKMNKQYLLARSIDVLDYVHQAIVFEVAAIFLPVSSVTTSKRELKYLASTYLSCIALSSSQ